MEPELWEPDHDPDPPACRGCGGVHSRNVNCLAIDQFIEARIAAQRREELEHGESGPETDAG
jgi:hypothetical protein